MSSSRSKLWQVSISDAMTTTTVGSERMLRETTSKPANSAAFRTNSCILPASTDSGQGSKEVELRRSLVEDTSKGYSTVCNGSHASSVSFLVSVPVELELRSTHSNHVWRTDVSGFLAPPTTSTRTLMCVNLQYLPIIPSKHPPHLTSSEAGALLTTLTLEDCLFLD